jgi:hypothetical protein
LTSSGGRSWAPLEKKSKKPACAGSVVTIEATQNAKTRVTTRHSRDRERSQCRTANLAVSPVARTPDLVERGGGDIVPAAIGAATLAISRARSGVGDEMWRFAGSKAN